MIETGLLFDANGAILHLHLPVGRNAGYLPDDRGLWEIMWAARHTLKGFAHTHPGFGMPSPSGTDLTTFSAVELGLGRKLEWWIATRDALGCWVHSGPSKLDYMSISNVSGACPPWLYTLRAHSGMTSSLYSPH